MRLGVFGGTFDPIHIGHLVAAVNARHALTLDKVLLVVASVPWQKTGARHVTPGEDRFAVVRAALEAVDGLEASRLELDRPGPSYTVDTLETLAAAGHELFLIVGPDVAAELDTWERPDDVRRLARLAVVTRPGHSPPPGLDAEIVMTPGLDVSSTDLRDRLADGRPVDFLIPAAAVHCIRARGLYAGGPRMGTD